MDKSPQSQHAVRVRLPIMRGGSVVLEHKHGCLSSKLVSMIPKIWSSDFRKLGIACKNLGTAGRIRLLSLYFMVMDCIKTILNGWGMRFLVMTLCKLWTLVLYVLRRQLKTVSCLFVFWQM